MEKINLNVPQPPENIIEHMIDREGIGLFLEEVIEICYQKADHVRSNWQDGQGEPLAKAWEKVGELLDAKMNTKPMAEYLRTIEPIL
jgi:hypothetical protein